jgi:hypothetical protein
MNEVRASLDSSLPFRPEFYANKPDESGGQ